jgi:predicted molibdopterin-dependent oxidoreductase YjgC
MKYQNLVILSINGRSVSVPAGSTVAAAVLASGVSGFRTSVTGALRGPVCGMGVCFECRLTIDGRPGRTSCQTVCQPGMEVVTDAG